MTTAQLDYQTVPSCGVTRVVEKPLSRKHNCCMTRDDVDATMTADGNCTLRLPDCVIMRCHLSGEKPISGRHNCWMTRDDLDTSMTADDKGTLRLPN